MDNAYNEIGSILKESGYNEVMSYITDPVTGNILYISLYIPVVLLYSKVESIKKILHSYDIEVSSNPNIECITIKIV